MKKIIVSKYNYYDRLLIIFIALQVFGLYGGTFQPLRIITMLFFPFFVIGFFKNEFLKNKKFELAFFYVFFLTGLVSIFYAYSTDEAIKDLFYVGFNCILFFTIIYLAFKSANPKMSIIYGWILFFVLSVPIAFLELFYDYHLSMTVIEEGTLVGGLGVLKRYAAVGFGNFNAYNLVLVYTFPFLSANIILQKKSYVKILNLFLMLFLYYIVITNASRAGFVCLSIGLVYFILKYYKLITSNRISLLVVIILLFFVVIEYIDSLFFMIFFRLNNGGFEDYSRNEIINNGLQMFMDSNLLGVGGGNFSEAIKRNFHVEISAPHNMFLEILVQYGMVVFVGFIILLFRIYCKSKKVDLISNYIVLLSLLILPIAAVINSSYVQSVNTWVYLASLWVISDKRFLKLYFVGDE